jgi:hypothetical protein
MTKEEDASRSWPCFKPKDAIVAAVSWQPVSEEAVSSSYSDLSLRVGIALISSPHLLKHLKRMMLHRLQGTGRPMSKAFFRPIQKGDVDQSTDATGTGCGSRSSAFASNQEFDWSSAKRATSSNAYPRRFGFAVNLLTRSIITFENTCDAIRDNGRQ